MKKVFLMCLLLVSCIAFSQDVEEVEEKVEEVEEVEESKREGKRILPFRVGIVAGIPNGIGGNIEYVTPLLRQRIALYANYSGFSAEIDDVDTKLQYYEFGTNVYLFGGMGRLVYGSLGYGNLSIDGAYSDAQTIGGEEFTGTAEGSFEVSTFNVKAGVKLGKRFFFRTELGYGFGDVPQEIVITGEVNGMPAVGVEEVPDIPGMSENGYILFNIGFGVGF